MAASSSVAARAAAASRAVDGTGVVAESRPRPADEGVQVQRIGMPEGQGRLGMLDGRPVGEHVGSPAGAVA